VTDDVHHDITTVSDQYPVPTTGVLVSLDDETECAQALEDLRRIEARIREAKRVLAQAVAARAALFGTKTMPMGDGRQIVLSGGTVDKIDAEVLENGLRVAGMPDDRLNEIVKQTVVTQVDVREAKRAAAANPEYAAALERATEQEDAPWRVTVK
jgi:hypothetical protein